MGTKAAPPYANLSMGRQEQTIHKTFIWAIPFWKRFIDDICLIFLGTTNQLQSLQDFMNHLHPTIKFIFQHSTQQISFLDMKIQIGENHKLYTTLLRKPTDCAALLHFHSNHWLKHKESIVFSQALKYNLLIADDHLLQKELDSLAISLLDRKYPLDIISHNISKALLHPPPWTHQGIRSHDRPPDHYPIFSRRQEILPINARQMAYWKWPPTTQYMAQSPHHCVPQDWIP